MSRLLFTCRPLFGHYEPLRPLATAARDAGHVVAFATGAPADSWARHDGFEAFPAGPGEDFRQEWGPRVPSPAGIPAAGMSRTRHSRRLPGIMLGLGHRATPIPTAPSRAISSSFG